MRIFAISLVVSIICYYFQWYDEVLYLITGLMIIKGVRVSQNKDFSMKEVFNLDLKLTKYDKNNIFELLSVIVILFVSYEGFSVTYFESVFDVMFFIGYFLLTYFFFVRSMEKKIFAER